jgi:hypothetical protein
MATSPKSSSKPKAAAKNPRKKLSIAEQRAKIEAAKAKIAALESRLAVNDMKDYLINLKVPTVGDLFKVALEGRKTETKLNVLQTLAEIGGLKVTITEKVKVARKPKVAAK